jgi:hypothetical protein
MVQPFIVQPSPGAKGNGVAQLDALGNSQFLGHVEISGTLILDRTAAAPLQTPKAVTLYTTDGQTVVGIGADGNPAVIGQVPGLLPTTAPTVTGTALGLYSNAGVLTVVDASGTSYPVSQAGSPAALNSLVGWTFDPVGIGSGVQATAGNVFLQRVVLPVLTTVTSIVVQVTNGGSSLTSGQNFAAIYNAAGTRVGITADQTTPWATTGIKTMNLTAPVTLEPGTYYVARLVNASVTTPSFGASTTNALVIAGDASAPFRFGALVGSATAMPSTITMSSTTSEAAFPFWTGLQ